MNKFLSFLLVFQTFVFNSTFSSDQFRDFNKGWKFENGIVAGLQSNNFDDSEWRTVSLPHDWGIEDLPNPGKKEENLISGPFDINAVAGKHSGFTQGGVGCYRKTFRILSENKGKEVYLQFDGIYMNADIWINETHVHTQHYGYTPFNLNITPYLTANGEQNVIAIEVKNIGVNSRWYSGSGIYRDVRISYREPVHIKPWGIYVTTPEIKDNMAFVAVETNVANLLKEEQPISLQVEIRDQGRTISSKTVSTMVFPGDSSKIKTRLIVENPHLWSLDDPHRYEVRCIVSRESEISDEVGLMFGIREIEYDSEKGMFLNGEHIQLNGGAVHANFGPLGAASFKSAEKRNVRLLKEAGFNAIRGAHNPHSRLFLDACDEIGMLVIDEAFDTWRTAKTEDDYHQYFENDWRSDLTNIILRDRNHPCIFAWSIGNQIRNAHKNDGVALAHEISDFVRYLDPSRPTTANVFMFMRNNMFDGSSELWKKLDPFFEAVDLAGYSYQSIQYENVHDRLPDRLQFSSEINPRDVFKNWTRVTDNPYVLGNFAWTAIDYMGEAGGGWLNGFNLPPEKVFPWSFSYTGDLDYCGFRKPRSYYREILTEEPGKVAAFVKTPVSTFPNDQNNRWGWDDVKRSWTWLGYEGKELEVHVYSKCDTVELFLNGNSIGTHDHSRSNEYRSIYNVSYKPGELKAVAYQNGQKKDEWILQTVGEAKSIRLTSDTSSMSADGMDLLFVEVEVVDEEGRLVPYAGNQIDFSIEGEGTIIGVGNGNPMSLESFQQPQRKAFEGRTLLIVRSTGISGDIQIKANSKNLNPGKLAVYSE